MTRQQGSQPSGQPSRQSPDAEVQGRQGITGSGPQSGQQPEQPAATDRQAGQEADRANAALRNTGQGYGNDDKSADGARDTARDVAKRHDEHNG